MAKCDPFREQLMDSLHRSVEYFNKDNDPNEAVTKAAQDYGFNTDQTTRLVEMFNTARTLYHFKSASDRTTSFPLADVDVVLGSLFDTPTKAASVSTDTPDYSEYDRRSFDYNDPVITVKAAEDITPTDEMISMDAMSHRAMLALRSLRQTAKFAEDEARAAATAASQLIEKVASTFMVGNDHGKMADQYARLMVGYRNQTEWQPVMNKLAACLPKKDHAPEAVMQKYAKAFVIDDRDLAPQLAMLKEAKEYMETESEFLAASDQFYKEADTFEADFIEVVVPVLESTAALASFIRPEVLKEAQTVSESKYRTRNMYGEPIDVTSKKEHNAPTSGFADMFGGMAGEAVKQPLTSFINTGVERAINEPAMRQNKAISDRLRNVQRQIMLQDLMTQDPVLSEETPETVAEAYNAIMQLAPEVAGNKEVVRAILRQTVHAVAVSPYDAEIWTKLENNLRSIRGKAPVAQAAGVKA